jgi:hypothetical protein
MSEAEKLIEQTHQVSDFVNSLIGLFPYTRIATQEAIKRLREEGSELRLRRAVELEVMLKNAEGYMELLD